MFLCAVVFAIHIHLIDYFAPRVNAVALSCLQFLVCGVLSCVPMLWLETPEVGALMKAAFPLLYAGVLSGGVAYTLQILGQQRTNPVTGSLLMSLESVFSVLAGYILLREVLTNQEILGCALMFLSIVVSQIPIPFRKYEYEET